MNFELNRTRSLQLFPTVVMGFLPTLPPGLRESLAEQIERRRAAEQSRGRSNALGWHGGTDFFAWSDETRYLETLLRRLLDSSILPQDTGTSAYAIQGWANVLVAGAFNRPHTHPGAMASGVFYVDVGDSAAEAGGVLEFFDPRGATEMYSSPTGMLGEGHIEALTPLDGEILVFPSWLRHWVTPYRGTKVRTSVAFNVVPRSVAG